MECTHNTPTYHLEQGDLINFNSDDEVLHDRNVSNAEMSQGGNAPVLKSTDRRRINSDVMAFKRGNGDVGFAAVGRVKVKNKGSKHRKGSLDLINIRSHEYEFVDVPTVDLCCKGGIDNPGYATITRGETFAYDHTGENYFSSYPQRWTNVDLLSKDVGQSVPSYSQEFIDMDVQDGGECVEQAQNRYEAQESAQDMRHVSQRIVLKRNHTDSTFQMILDEPGTDIDDLHPGHVHEDTPTNDSTDVEASQVENMDSGRDAEEDVGQGPESSDLQPHDKLPPSCKCCGQRHGVTENHEYNYVEEVDDDLTCDICLQPLLDPYDTKCGHTFCSLCIKNYLRVKHMCPIDRQEMTNTSSDCWQSSLVLRKLMDKLMVECPHKKFCKETVPRCELKDHLKERCPGAVVRCPKSMYGCVHKGARIFIKNHLEDCEYKDFDDKLSDLHPFSEDVTVELFRPEGTAELGIMIVGGSDTPLHYIIIQDIVEDGLVHCDGRLQVGDVIVEINGESMFSVTHAEARAALTKPSNLMRFGLLRNMPTKAEEPTECTTPPIRKVSTGKGHGEECVCLIKPPLEQLGIRISTSDTGAKGVYIIELIDGQVAQTDGRLQVGDRILAIGNTDLSESTPDQAARVIGNCDEEVKIVVRHMLMKPAEYAQDKMPLKKKSALSNLARSPSFPPVPKPVKSSHIKKIISVTKSQKENLGIIVSGGYNSPRGNLPIFVQDVLPMSVLGKDKQIKRGDLLSEINSCKLIGLSYTQAMTVLRESAQQREVSLVAYEVEYEGKAEDAALWDELTSLHQHPSKWAPSWKMWLSLLPEFMVVREVVMRKPSTSSFGIKITGGLTKEHGPSPVFITHVSHKCTASKHLKCGDEIIAVNKRLVKGMPYMHVLNLLKTTNYATLKIVSWPGSLH